MTKRFFRSLVSFQGIVASLSIASVAIGAFLGIDAIFARNSRVDALERNVIQTFQMLQRDYERQSLYRHYRELMQTRLTLELWLAENPNHPASRSIRKKYEALLDEIKECERRLEELNKPVLPPPK